MGNNENWHRIYLIGGLWYWENLTRELFNIKHISCYEDGLWKKGLTCVWTLITVLGKIRHSVSKNESGFFLDCKWREGDPRVVEGFERADLSVNTVASFWRAHQIRTTLHHFHITTNADPVLGALRAISLKRWTLSKTLVKLYSS
jgi:hypothetical protein